MNHDRNQHKAWHESLQITTNHDMNHHDDPKRALHKAIWLPCFLFSCVITWTTWVISFFSPSVGWVGSVFRISCPPSFFSPSVGWVGSVFQISGPPLPVGWGAITFTKNRNKKHFTLVHSFAGFIESYILKCLFGRAKTQLNYFPAYWINQTTLQFSSLFTSWTLSSCMLSPCAMTLSVCLFLDFGFGSLWGPRYCLICSLSSS